MNNDLQIIRATQKPKLNRLKHTTFLFLRKEKKRDFILGLPGSCDSDNEVSCRSVPYPDVAGQTTADQPVAVTAETLNRLTVA